MTSYVSNGLIAYFNPNNASSYSGSGATLNSLVGSGITGTLGGTYSYSNGTIRLTNTSGTISSNVSRLQVPSLSNIRTVSMWVYIHSANNLRYLLDARSGAANGFIASGTTVGSDWSGSTYYLNNGDIYDLTGANMDNFLSVTGQWVNITLISNSAFTDDITLFARFNQQEGLDCSFGPIMIYNRAITRAEQVQNFYASEHNYLRIRSKAINTYSSNGLIAYFNPNNSASYSGSGSAMTSLAGSGVTGTLGGTYSYSNGIIRIVNNTGAQITNNSRLQVSTLNNLRSVSMWVYLHSSTDDLYRILIDGYRWGEPFNVMNRGNISAYFSNTFFYVNNGNVYAMNDVNRYSFFSSTGVWTYVTFISNTPYTGGLTLFAESLIQSGLDCSFGPIMFYNRVLTRAEHIQNFYATEFNYIRSLISYQHPYIALTADSSNGYVASSSGTHDSSAFQAFKAFDLQSLDYDGYNYNFWHSPNSGNNYNSSTGAYLGATKTIVSGIGDIYGEYVQIQLPQSIVLTSFTITPRRDSDYNSRSPNDFVIVGSNDGSTWTQVYSTGGMITWDSELPRNFAVSGTPSLYSYYRLITKVVGNSGTSNRISVIITEWSLYTSTVSNINTPLYQHPLLTMTSNTSNGYVASASSIYPDANNTSFEYSPFKSFDLLSGDYSSTYPYNFWHSAATYTASTGVYTGSITTVVGSTTYSGEWIQLQLPYGLLLQSFLLTPRRDSDTDWTQRSPNNFVIVASNDGLNWSLVYTSGNITWTNENPRSFNVSTASQFFSIYRLITSVVGNSDQNTSRDSIQITEWNLLGTEIPLSRLTTPTSSNLPVIAGGPSSNTTNTLAYGRPGFVSFNRNSPSGDYPLVPLTSNSSNGYVASASTSLSNAWAPFQAVDSSLGSGWHSEEPATPYYNPTTGVYQRSPATTTTVSGVAYNGDWLQIQLPTAIILTSFSLRGREEGNLYVGRFPNDFVVAGSNDGSTWFLVFSATNTFWGSVTQTFTTSSSNTAYSYYRLVTTKVGNSDQNTGRSSVQIHNWILSSNAYQFLYTPSDNTIIGGAQVQKSTTFNISTNGGFTAVCLVRFTGTGSANERVFDFGNGTPNNNIILSRENTTAMYFSIFNGSTQYTALGGTIVQDAWTLLTVRYTKSSNFMELYQNGAIAATLNNVPTITDRSLVSNYIAKSNWSVNPHTNMDLAGLLVYDRSLDIDEITTCSNILYGSVATTSVPATPVYRLLAHDLMNLNASQPVSNWGQFIQATAGNRPTYSDVIQWTGLGKSILPDCQAVAFNPKPGQNRWIAGGGGTTVNNALAYSGDGVNWTQVSNFIVGNVIGAFTNGSVWVVTGANTNGTTNSIAVSADNGLTWSGKGTSLLNVCYEAAWNPKNGTSGRWVAGGNNSNTTISLVYSDDNGTTWTAVPNSTSISSNVSCIQTTVLPDGSTLWVLGGIDGSNKMAWSLDGLTWTGLGNSLFNNYCYDIQYNGVIWVAVGRGDSSNNIATSFDGKTWTGRGRPFSSAVVREVSWTGNYWTAVAEPSSGENSIIYSEDGIKWTSVSNSTTLLQKGGAIGSRSFNLLKQTLTFNDITKTVGDAAFTPSVSTDAVPSYSSYTFSVPAGNGVATTDGTTITIVGAGQVIVTVNQASDGFYEAATATALLTSSIAPTLSGATNVSYTYNTAVGSVYAGSDTVILNNLVSSNSSGALSFSVSNTSPVGCASIVSSNLVFTQAGTVTIGVTQAAASGYNAITTPVTFDITLSKATPTISGNSNLSYTYNQSGAGLTSNANDFQVDLSVVATPSLSPGGTYSYSMTSNAFSSLSDPNITFTGVGTTNTITATRTASAFYNQATTTFTVQLSKATPTISGATTKSFTYGTSATGYNGSTDVDLTAVGVSSNSAGTLSYTEYTDPTSCGLVSNNTLIFTKSGIITIRVNQTETNFYNALSTLTTFNVELVRGTQTLTFNDFSKTILDSNFTPTVVTDADPSYISYIFSVNANNGVVITDGGTISIVGLGSTLITVVQAQNDFYFQKTTTATITVTKANSTINASNITTTYALNQTIDLATLSNLSSDSTGSFSYSILSGGSYATITTGSTLRLDGATPSGNPVQVRITQSADTNYLQNTKDITVTINKGTATINASNITTTYVLNGTIDLATLSNLNSDSTGSFSYSILSGSSYATITTGSTLRLDNVTPVGSPVQVRITQSADTNYIQNTKDITVTILNSQTVSFSSATNTFNETSIGATFALSGRATSATSSSNPIQYSLANNSGVAIISGSNIVIQGGGVFTLRASQPAFEHYGVSNTAEQTITVYLSQNVEFSSILSFGSDLVGSTISLSGLATSSTNGTNPIQYELVDTPTNVATISNNSLEIAGSGVITLRAYQNAGGYYNATTTYNLNQWSFLSAEISCVSSDDTGTYVIRGSSPTPGVVERSIDKGDTWSTLNIPYVSNAQIRYVYSNSSGTVLTVTTGDRIYISRDSGSTWSSYAPPTAATMLSNQSGVIAYTKAITNQSGTKILVINSFDTDYIYLSVDSGTSWNTIATSIQGWIDFCANSNFTIFAACTDYNVYVSLNGGIDWIETTPSNSPSNRVYRRIACNSSGSRIYVTSAVGQSNGNIYYSANYGQTWKTKGISTSWSSIACDASGTIVIAGDGKSDGNLWTSFDGGDNWIVRSIGVNNILVQKFTDVFCSGNGRVLFATSFQSVALYRSFNDSRIIIPDRKQQVLSFTLPPTISYGAVTTLSASSTSGLSDFLFSSFNPNIATVVQNVSPTLVPQGVGSVTVASYQDGDATYLPASTTASTTIIKGTPTISGATAKTFTYGISATGYNGTTTVDLTALGITSTSNGLLSYTEYADTQNCGTVSNNILTFSKAGTITIRVNQESTSLYTDLSGLSVTFTVQLLKANPTISGATTKNFAYTTTTVDLTTVGVSSNSSGTLSYTEYADPDNIGTVSNNILTVSSNILTISKAGTITIQVNQTAGNFHDALSSTVTFDIVFATSLLRSRLNLWDESRTKRFRIQHTSSNTTLVLNENKLNITDGVRTVTDIVSLLTKVQPMHTQINSLEVFQTVPAEDYSASLVSRASVLENNIFSQSSLIARAQDSIISLSTRASVYEDNVASQASLIVRARDSMTSLSSRAGIHEENVASQASLIIRAQDSIASLSTRAGIYEKDVALQSSIILKSLDSIVSLSSRAHLYEENIASQASLTIRALDSMTSLSSRAGIYEENIASQGSIVSRSLDSMTSLSTRAGLYEENIFSQGSLATRALDSIVSLSTRAGVYEENIASQGSLVTRAHNSITSLSIRANLYENAVASQGSLATRALDSMTSLSTRASVYEDNVASQASLAIRALDSIVSLSTRASVYENNVASQASLAIRAQDSIISLSTRAGVYEENIFSQGSLAIRAQDSIISLSTRAGVYEDNVASQASLAIRALDSVSSLSSRASLHEKGIASQGSLAIRALDSLTSLTTRFSNIEVNILGEAAKMTNVETHLSFAKDALYTIFDGNPNDANYSTLQLITTTINANPNIFSVEQIQSRLDYITSVIDRLTDNEE